MPDREDDNRVSTKLTLFLHSPIEDMLHEFSEDAKRFAGLSAAITRHSARSFTGDTVYVLVLQVSAGIAANVVVSLLTRWLTKMAPAKVTHESKVITVDETTIRRIVTTTRTRTEEQ